METKTVGIIALIALLIGGGIGYSINSSGSASSDSSTELQQAVSMMKDQSRVIKTMAEQMKTGGMMMQGLSATYKNDTMMSTGKDWEMMGTKYMQEATDAESKSGMNEMMQ